jgi:hypothetical protein
MTKRILGLCLAFFSVACAARAQSAQYWRDGAGQVVPVAAETLLALANEARAQHAAGKLQWDESLADAARRHCLRMAEEGPIAHRYGGEPDVAGRAGQAGAHFDLIEENVAVGPTAAEIHNEWMNSPGHRTNLLNPDVNRVGIAVVSVRGVLYATADYARNVQALTQTQVEARVGELLRANGASISQNNAQARAACKTSQGIPPSTDGRTAGFVMRWQSADLSRLPEALTERLASGRYHQASIGSCPAQDLEGNFTAYRIAVLLY